MKKFAINGIIILTMLFLLDFFVGKILKHFYYQQTSGFQYRTTYSMEQSTEDILVFGSSRANHHYKPEIFEKDLQHTFYNTGRDGHFLFYQTAVLKSVLKRHKPKLIIYDVAGSFIYDESDYDRLSSLLPYYDNHTEIRDIVNLRSRYEPIKNLSNLYPYNSTIANIIIGNLKVEGIRSKEIKGYVPLHGQLEGGIQKHSSVFPYETDNKKIEIFNEFLNLCQQQKIQVIVVMSPVYYVYEKDFSLELYKKICDENKIQFFDFTRNNDFLDNPHYFDDISHLNDKGASLFSKKVANLVKNKLNDNRTIN